MKRLLLAVLLTCNFIGLAVSISPQVAMAATNPFDEACNNVVGTKPDTCNQTGSKDPVSGADQEGLLIKAVRLVAMLTGIASVIAIMIGGIEYTMSGGEPAKLNTAKNTIIFAVVGLAIAMMAGVILRFVLRKL